jgi:hypothetical protein
VRAFSLAGDSNDGCKPDGSCTAAGLDAFQRGKAAANLSNGFVAAGGVVGAAGAVLLILTAMEPSPAPAAARAFQIAPVVGPGAGVLSVRGAW